MSLMSVVALAGIFAAFAAFSFALVHAEHMTEGKPKPAARSVSGSQPALTRQNVSA